MKENDDIGKKLQDAYPQYVISYGGDGTLVGKWRIAHSCGLPVFPVRNYSRCQKHDNEVLNNLLSSACQSFRLFPEKILSLQSAKATNDALAEIQIKNADITAALRFDVFVNGKKFYSNVIADAVVVSTPLGSTGYWKSITRAIFRSGFGLTFVAPTIGISSLVLKDDDVVDIMSTRSTNVLVAADKERCNIDFNENDKMTFKLSDKTVEIVNYDDFMCFECRKLRSSTTIQDQFII